MDSRLPLTRAARLRCVVIASAIVSACGGDDGGATPTSSTSSSGGEPSTQGTGDTTAASTESTATESTVTDVDATGTDTTGADTTGGESTLLDEYLLDGDTMFPEGVAFDPVTQAFFVGSLTDAGITRIDGLDGTQSMFVPSSETHVASAGMKVDAAARLLWVCGSDDAGSPRIYVYGIDDNSLVETFELGLLVDTASCNDLALDADGAAYVTDPPSSAIHRVALGGDAAVWSTDLVFAPELNNLGLNGIAVTPDGTAVIVTKFIAKQLLRVSTDDPTEIAEITLEGDDFAGGSLVAGPDGIVFDDDVLYVVFDDAVAQVTLNADWTSGDVTMLTPPTTGLSTATIAEGEVYAVKSEVTAYALGSEPELPFRIVRVPTG